MNHVALIGRLTKDPDVRATQSGEQVARYTLAVDRMGKDKSADFISCVAFGKTAEFVQKYLRKGIKIGIEGRIQTGSYQKQDGTKVYTTDVIVNRHTFCEKIGSETIKQPEDDFVNVPEGLDDTLPF